MPSAISALYTSSADRWRTLLASKSSRILRRGSVALRPLSFRLCTVLIGCHYMRMHLSPFRTWMAASCLACLAGCGYVPQIPGVAPYRIDIQQGNFVSQDMVAQLKQGMSKDQVRLVLGTPLLTDVFHADRWDYVYWREKPGAKRESRKLTVFFEDGKLTRLDGDGVAAGATQ